MVIGVTWKATYHARKEGSMSRLLTVMFTNGTCPVFPATSAILMLVWAVGTLYFLWVAYIISEQKRRY